MTISRRSFIGGLAALPFIGKFVKAKESKTKGFKQKAGWKVEKGGLPLIDGILTEQNKIHVGPFKSGMLIIHNISLESGNIIINATTRIDTYTHNIAIQKLKPGEWSLIPASNTLTLTSDSTQPVRFKVFKADF